MTQGDDNPEMRPPRRRLVIRAAAAILLLLVVGWAGGFLWFVRQIPDDVDDAAAITDAIVVLTGGSGRLEEGFELLAQGRARQLFVSGVYRGIDVRELLRVTRESRQYLDCCVAIGYEADSTHGNAQETALWMREQNFSSMRLVTASYHMPRSLLEFRNAMPDIRIVPHPVFTENFKQDDWWRWPGSTRLVISEYLKYLAALGWSAVAP